MKRMIFSLGAAFAVATAGLGSVHAASAAAPPPTASHAPKDGCSDKKTKFEHDKCEKFIHSAPGDEYFGRMKMSFLGINNTFHDEYIRAGDYTTDSNVINKVNFADEALTQWAQRYPGDPQLARSYFLAIKVYKKIYLKEWQDKAWAYMNTLVHHFGDSYFGKLEKKDIQVGFTEHYFALAQLCPTPMPTGSGVPKFIPNTSPVPSPAPTPTPKPGSPKVDIIVPPCVQPSPVVTSPTPAPSNFPSPASTGSPATPVTASPTTSASPTPTPSHKPHSNDQF